MPTLRIDNREIEIADGSTILDAAAKLAIEIPTMCFLRTLKPSTSCMLCLVKVLGRDDLLPSCGTLAEQGMDVQTDTEEIRQARRMALELLLSDHVGDCLGPCQPACPAKMNIPLMLRQIAAAQYPQAIATIKRDIALPAVLGRICPAPCVARWYKIEFPGALLGYSPVYPVLAPVVSPSPERSNRRR